MTNELVLTKLNADGVFTITLNRPKVNAFNHELTKETLAAFRQAGRNPDVRAVIFTAAGGAFSAGQDLSEVQAAEGVSFRAHLQKTYNPLVLAIRQLEKPVLAAINGTVAGAAFGLVLACDLRIAVEGTRFVVGFNGIGLAPDSAISLLLPALIGLGRATEATYFNQPISDQQALEWGLVNKLVSSEELPAAALAAATQLANGPAQVYGLTKRAFNQAVLPNLEAVLDYEAYLQEIAGNSAEHKEGLAAFIEKRPANYKG